MTHVTPSRPSGWLRLAALALFLVAATGAETLAQDAVRVVHGWNETHRVDGREVPVRVEVVFDYQAGVARERTYDVHGTLLATRDLVGQPPPSNEEVQEAIEIIRADAELGALALAQDAVIDGGFILEEEAKEGQVILCGAGTRCLQMDMLDGNKREKSLRFVVVDLVSGQIVYRNHSPH